MLPKVFIIILNWNNWVDTKDCLESLKTNGYQNCEVVVVDNGSDEKPEITNPKIKVIYNKENLGFSGGNNVGIKYALENGADYVLILNNDTIASDDFLVKLVEAGESDKKIGFLGPKIYFAASNPSEVEPPKGPFGGSTSERDSEGEQFWCAGGAVNWV